MSDFQTQVNVQPSPAVAGDFASANPRATVLADAGGLVAGANGVTVGRFAWVDPSAPTIANNFGSSTSGAPIGFVHREQQALITQWLGKATQVVPPGLPVTLHQAGDFWAVNEGVSAAAVNDIIYASYADGSISPNTIQTAAAFTASVGGSVTAEIGAAISSATGSGTNLTVITLTSGVINVGDILIGTGIPTGTYIVSQTSGTPGDTGVYVTSQATTGSTAAVSVTSTILNVTVVSRGFIYAGDIVTNATIANSVISSVLTGTVAGVGTYRLAGAAQYMASAAAKLISSKVLHVTAVASGTLHVGDPIATLAVTSGSVIAALGTGVGNIGNYTLNKNSTNVASGSAATVCGVATKWKAMSAGAVGELIKISSWLLG